jgi:hypothetical protein
LKETSLLDPDPRTKMDEYDGHANYREQFAPRPAGVVLRNLVRGLLSIAVGITITWVVHKLLYPGPNLLVLFTAGFAGLVGLIGGCISYWLLSRELDDGPRPIGVLDAIAVAIFIFAFVIPLSVERADEKREHQLREAQRRVAERERDEYVAQRKAEAMTKLRRLGRFAEPGIVPPDFEVVDQGSSVSVTNRGEKSTSISLSRVLRDSETPTGWKGCALWTGGPHGHGRYYGHYINPGMTLSFSMYDGCLEEFRDAPLEYRVGEPTMEGEAGDRAWWSESAFASPDGRERETFRRLAESRTPTEPSPDRGDDGQYRPEQVERHGVKVESASETEPTASEPAGTRDVIKCRDASGAVQFTQGYCPPGTTPTG